MKKKVLIITYYWPPAGGIAVVRWVKFSKYLCENEWEPVIYTVSNGSYPLMDASLIKDVPENLHVLKRPIWEPHRMYQFFSRNKNSGGLGDIKPKYRASATEKISNWLRSNFFIPDARAFWIRPSIKYLTSYLKENPVSAIVSTGPPHSTHLIALGLKKKTGLPWLADFRDPWTTMDYYNELLLTLWADREHHRMELQVLKTADAVTVVGGGMKTEFEGKSKRRVSIVTNGFDEADFAKNKHELDREFTIVHVGTFFSRINPTNLWEVLAELKKENHPMFLKLKIKLMGRVDPIVIESIQNSGLNEFLRLTPFQPHDEAVQQISSAQVLLLCIFEQTKFVLTGKLFEYLATQRPILMIGPTDGDAAQILSETGAGQCFSFGDRVGIKQHVVDLYLKFERGESNFANINSQKYSHRQLAKQVASLLNLITAQP